MPLLAGQILHNRYRIEKLLGQGGMGAVYRAWDISLDVPVAIKENLDSSAETQKQFAREARILARLSHPNLPRVTDHFFIPGQGQYLVMDFVEGEDLGSMLQRLGALPEPQVLTWITQICDALAYLHSQSSPIIHRDIKPSNIKVRIDGKAVLVDFGIAKVYNPRLVTTVGAKAVTPGYSPPEQYGMGVTDARSDIYALGATLYHLLTGQAPPESVQRLAEQKPMPTPRQINQQITPLVEQVILKAVEVTTERRFQNVAELRNALAQRQEIAVTPVEKQPTAPVPPAGSDKTAKKLLPLFVVAGIIGIVCCVVLAVVLYRALTNHDVTPTPEESPSPPTEVIFTTTAPETASIPPTYTIYPTLTPYPTYTPYIAPTATPSPDVNMGTVIVKLCPTADFAGNVCEISVTVFPKGTDTIYATWQMDLALAQHTAFTRRWYQEGRLILETSNEAGENARWTPRDGRSYYVYLSTKEGSGKTIFNAPAFPSGNYGFELIVDGNSTGVVNFMVK